MLCFPHPSLLDRVRDLQKTLGKPTDPYADDNAAAFYRLPAGFRRAKRNQDREEAGRTGREGRGCLQLSLVVIFKSIEQAILIMLFLNASHSFLIYSLCLLKLRRCLDG